MGDANSAVTRVWPVFGPFDVAGACPVVWGVERLA